MPLNAKCHWPLVSVVIANFNGSPFIEKCLTSVFNTDYPSFEVIFVDDASTDGSVELVKKLFGSHPNLRIVRNARNIGAAAAKNIGIDTAKGDVICFLDNDTEVDSDWLKEMIKVLQSDSSVGATMSKLLDINARTKIQVAGVFIISYVGWAIARGGGKDDDGSYDSVMDICALSTALAVKREAIGRVGFFDPKLAVFTEDLDFSWRMWLAGYRIALAPKSIVYHWTKPLAMYKRVSASEIQLNFNLTKNSLRTFIKNYSLKNLARYLPLALTIIILRALLVFIKRKDTSVIVGSFKGIFWNISHFKDTLRERHRVQHFIRRVPDNYVMERIMISESPLQIYKKYFQRTGLL